MDYSRFIGLYCLYQDTNLVYVGEAGLETQRTIFERLKTHRSGALAGRWDKFSWFGRLGCAGQVSVKSALQQLEAISIAIINPGFNKQSGCFAGAKQVYQAPHEDAVGDVETRLGRMEEAIYELTESIDKIQRRLMKS